MEASKVRESEVNKMMSEVSKVITSHLNNLVDRFEENTKNMVSTVEILKELPIIKDLETRLEHLKAENIKLKTIIKEMKCQDKKHIVLKTEEINDEEISVSYSDIDALVTDQVTNKNNEGNFGSYHREVGSYMDYMANQSDTDTSEDETVEDDEDDSNEKSMESAKSTWIHTPNPGTLLGTWSSKDQTDNDKTVESAEKARDAEEASEEVDDAEAEEDDAEEEEDDAEEEEDDAEEEEDDEAEEEEEDEDEADEDDEAEEEEEDDGEDEAEEEEEDEDEEDEAEEDDAEEDEDEDDEAEDDEELEVEEIEIEGVTYYCTDENNGILFECGEDGEIGDEIGYLKKGSVFFS